MRVGVALCGALFGFVVVALSLLPGAPYLPDGVEFIPFALIFPLFGWAVIERSLVKAARLRKQPRRKWYEQAIRSNKDMNESWSDFGSQLLKYRSPLAIAVPLVALMWIVGFISIISSQGQPEHSGDHYYLDDHGTHIVVTRSGYERAIAQQERIFAAGGTTFLIVAAAMTLSFTPEKSGNNGVNSSEG